MDDRYLGAFLCLNSHTVCGRRLKPFSLRHRMVLRAIDSPCLPGCERSMQMKDLILAARVCSIDDPQEAVAGGGLKDAITILLYRHNPVRYARDLAAWVRYLEDIATHPIIGARKSEKAARNRGVDWSLSVVTKLMALGFSEEEAWTMPEGRALFYFYASAIQDGADLEIATTDQEALVPIAREAIAKAIREAEERRAKAGLPPRKPETAQGRTAKLFTGEA